MLAQQIVAEVAAREWAVDELLFSMVRRAWPYRALSRDSFDQVIRMLADGYTTRRGRQATHVHYDVVNGLLRGRRGARLMAITNGGAIPDQFDYDVVMLPEEFSVGTLNEDFAFESLPGDIFQLGNTSYRILKVEPGKVFRRGCERSAAEYSVLVRRGAGPDRRIVVCRFALARRRVRVAR